MCQVGAYGMAAAGYSYREILRHYYRNVDVERAELRIDIPRRSP